MSLMNDKLHLVTVTGRYHEVETLRNEDEVVCQKQATSISDLIF